MPGHDGGAKPRQEFAGGAAQDGTRGAMASGAPVWASRRRAAGARAPAIALFRGALQISHASIRPHVAHYAPFLRAGHSHLAGVPAAAFSACAARSARLRTAGSICSPGSGARADPLWPCDLRRLPRCSEPGYATGGSSHPGQKMEYLFDLVTTTQPFPPTSHRPASMHPPVSSTSDGCKRLMKSEEGNIAHLRRFTGTSVSTANT